MASGETQNVWIDTDPSIGLPFRDVDDGLALLQAFRTPNFRIKGISTSYGNASLKSVTSIAHNLVQRYGADKSVDVSMVHTGADSPKHFTAPTPASLALAKALEAGPLIYLALAPLTNLAALLSLRPDLAHRLERVIFVGGRTLGQRFFFGRCLYEFHDANFEKDIPATQFILYQNLPLELVPIELSATIQLTRNDLKKVALTCLDSSTFLKETWLWSFLWEKIVGLSGGPAFDSVATLAASNPEYFTHEQRYASILNNQLIANQDDSGSPVKFYTSARTDAVKCLVELMQHHPVYDSPTQP